MLGAFSAMAEILDGEGTLCLKRGDQGTNEGEEHDEEPIARLKLTTSRAMRMRFLEGTPV
jgi:hypothetical protein